MDAHLDLGRVLPSAPKEPQAPQQDVGVGAEADGLHRMGGVSPATAMTYEGAATPSRRVTEAKTLTKFMCIYISLTLVSGMNYNRRKGYISCALAAIQTHFIIVSASRSGKGHMVGN